MHSCIQYYTNFMILGYCVNICDVCVCAYVCVGAYVCVCAYVCGGAYVCVGAYVCGGVYVCVFILFEYEVV